MRQKQARYVFPGGNTPKGFHSFYRQNLNGLERVFILKGGPGVGKSTLMRKIGTAMMERGYDVEFWQCSSDNDSLDGVIVPALNIGIIDGTAPHIVDPLYPGAVDEIINLGEHWDESHLSRHKEEIISISQAISQKYTKCYNYLQRASLIREKWEAQSDLAVDGEKLVLLGQELLDNIFAEKGSKIRYFFAATVTPRGLTSFAESITANCRQRYILQGQPGWGQDVLLAQIVQAALDRGHNLEVFCNTFDPEKFDMVHLPDLKIAIIDASVSHNKIIIKPEDKEIQMEEALLCPGEADESLSEQFLQLVESASEQVAGAKALHDKLEVYYTQAMNFEAIDKVGNRVFNKILDLVK